MTLSVLSSSYELEAMEARAPASASQRFIQQHQVMDAVLNSRFTSA